MSTRVAASLVAGSLVVLLVAPLAAQKFITGFFMGTESGTPIELIAWAEPSYARPLKMYNGSLEDAPILPRTYRALLNLGSYDLIGVIATTREAFTKSLDRIEHRDLNYSVARLAITTYEIGVPELEDWSRIERLRKNLKATPENPMIVFFVVTNGANVRYYPYFLERD